MNSTIVFASDDPGVGGVAKYNHSIKKALSKQGYQVISIHPQNYHDRLSLEQETKLGINKFEYSPKNGQELYNYLSNLVTNNKIDLFFCSNTNPFSNLIIKDFAVSFNIPLVIVEGLVEEYLAEKFKDYLDALEKHYQKSNAVICVSHHNLALLRQFFNLSRTKGTVIHYGRPESYFQAIDVQKRVQLRQELGIPNEGFVCFTSARLEKRKGYEYQIQAIKKLKNSEVWSKLYFVWAGGGMLDPQMEADVRDFIAKNSLENKIYLLGQVPAVLEWLNIADLFMLPSCAEGMPLSIMEAMAKGLPVLASAVSGIPEELGNTGYLVPDPTLNEAGAVEGIVQAIQIMVLNPDAAVAMGQQCQKRAKALFTETRMVEETLTLLRKAMGSKRDYISPGLKEVKPDKAFPNLVSGDTNTCRWPYLRREIPHHWYVDQSKPIIGFLSRDEAHILYNTALQFQGENALEIGCWLGWSACHLALAGVKLDVVDPLLSEKDIYQSVYQSLSDAGVIDSVNLFPGYSPQKVEEISEHHQRQWSLIFIDGNHEAPGPLNDAILCEKLAKDNAMVLFHDLASPDVAQGLDYFRDAGWQTMVYQTMQIMGIAWRGNVTPVQHQPDPDIDWSLPRHLSGYTVCQLESGIPSDIDSESWAEFQTILHVIRPYTLLSTERLFSLYSLTKKVCINEIPGNFVECGTYKGGSAGLMAAVIQKYSRQPRFLYAFDTYEGMPEPTSADISKGISAESAGYGAGALKAPIEENLRQVIEKLGVNDIVIPVKGLFADTLPLSRQEIQDIALLHADGDWYESTMDIFTLLYAQVHGNGFIQIDDYGYWDGCRKAIHDFERSQKIKFHLYPIDDTGVWLNKADVKENMAHDHIHAHLQDAIALLENKDFPEALKTLNLAFSLTEESGRYINGMYLLKAQCLCQAGRHREALEAVNAELKEDPKNEGAINLKRSLEHSHSRINLKPVATHERTWNTALASEQLWSIQNASHNYSYKGIPMIKNPFDFALYPLLLWNEKPRTIIEIGSKDGGSAIWLADMMESFGIDGHIYSVDIVKVMAIEHDRVTYIEGNGRKLAEVFSDEFLKSIPRPLLVIEDADHSYETSISVLNFFHSYLQENEFIVVEDGIISDLVQDHTYNSGPHKALKEFIPLHRREYIIDSTYCDFFGYNLTWCTNGFLKRVNLLPETGIGGQETVAGLTSLTEVRDALVVVDGVFFQLYQTGIARVWRSLLDSWANTPFASHLLVLDRNGTAPHIDGIQYRMIPGYSYQQTEADRQLLEAVCREEGADCFISTYYTTPIETPSVFMAYDMIPEVMNWNLQEPMWQEKHRAIQGASAYLSISHSTAKDLAQFFPDIDISQIKVSLCGVSETFNPSSEAEIHRFKEKYKIIKPYFIIVGAGGGVNSYKNPKLFFEAFAQLPTQLGFEVICTGTTEIDPVLQNMAFGTQVHALTLSDDDLKHAYSGAVAMVYPSKYEGFGLPIVEAMACGCPVITSSNASIPEVAGEAALYIDDSSVDEMVTALCEIQKPALRQSLIAAGLRQAKQFSWDSMAAIVQNTLLIATLPFELKPTTYLIFPDWSANEDGYGEAIQHVIYALSQHPQNDQIMLLIENSTMDAEDVNLLLSGIAMNLMMLEEINIEEGIEIAVTGDLAALQWQALLDNITGRIILGVDNTNKIAEVGGDRLPTHQLDTLQHPQAN